MFLCECIVNIVAGTLSVTRSSMQQYKRQIKRLSGKKTTLKERRVIFISTKGLRIIQIFAPKVIDRFPCSLSDDEDDDK